MTTMLVSFSVSNFRSFRDATTLDLRSPQGRARAVRPWDGNLEAVAAVYGANASGKTSLVSALGTMRDQVVGSYRRSRVEAAPFAFDAAHPTAPTEFSATFIAADGECYAYGFGVLDGRVVEEWAERYRSARATALFTREGPSVRFGAALTGPNRAVAKTMGDSNLFLSAAAAAGHPGLKPISDWFKNGLRVFRSEGYESFLSSAVEILAEDSERRARVIEMLRRYDLGLTGLDFDTRQLSDAERGQIERIWSAMRASSGEDAPRDLDLPEEMTLSFATHTTADGEFRLPLEEESDGTRAMLCHAVVVDEALAVGETVVFDELEASLHPLLVRELVAAFQDRAANPRQAQLVFTTHDVSLLEAGYGEGAQLARDEVWIVEKDADGVSALVPVADFAPRTRENLARRYLSGRFGGVPATDRLAEPVRS
jgi:ABC-type molybdenum transport system ATPase subunit/photorepair protein PhrA